MNDLVDKNREAYENKEALMKVFDEQDCWTHVAHHYLQAIRGSVFVTYKQDGTPDMRDPASRTMKAVAEALGYVITKNSMKKR